MTYSVAVIGAGPDPDNPVSGESFSMGYRHAWAFEDHEDCEIVAVADVVRENAEAFADEFGIDDDAVFEDHSEMLAAMDLNVVSIAVPPTIHAELTIDCAQAGVDAVHCEKPMADTWGKSVRMAQECWRRGVQLTFNHQLRYHDVTQKAKDLVDDGAIGELERIEMSRKTLFDAGSHQIDLANYFNDDVSASWVLGAIDYREENEKFGVHNANQALSQWQYDNGVYGLAATGAGTDFVGHSHRLLGSEGTIELDFFDPEAHVTVETTDGVEKYEFDSHNPIDRAAADVIEGLETDKEPLVSAKKVLTTNELIFATYESVRQRGRIDLPLESEDNPLQALVEAGEVGPDAE
jgi:predicted dehydrogenase